MGHSLSILSVAYPLFPVSADSAGGAEQILYLVERGLVEAGHRSLVVAAEGSQVSGELFSSPAALSFISDEDRTTAQRTHKLIIEHVLSRDRVDLVHFHGLDFSSYLPTTQAEMLATLHLPPSWYPAEAFSEAQVQLACVSSSQASDMTSGRHCTVVENGIDLVEAPEREAVRKNLLWLGRICPEKGTDIALRVAHKWELPLTVAGPVHPFPSHLAYFEGQVQPLLDSARCHVGLVGRSQKTQLLQRARALLVPSLAQETSSLVAMEAISAGTPVIAFRSGALPEIVEHGVTGFIVDSEEEMGEAVSAIDQIDRQTCIQRAAVRFSATAMIKRYLSLYEDLVMRRRHFGIGTAPQDAL